MKKLIVCFLLSIFSMTMLIGCIENKENSMTGIYVKALNGSHIIIDENNTPIVMGIQVDRENIFDDLKSGDKIKITYDSIAETYPEQTKVLSCKLIKEGSKDDIPEEVLNRLKEMGYKF